jgi:hypothetical protein
MKLYRWCPLVILASLSMAQDAAPPAALPSPINNDVLRVIDVKQADAGNLVAALKQVVGGMAVVTADTARRVVIVRGAPSAVAVVEAAVKQLDQPPAQETHINVELSVSLLYASSQEARGDPLPADLTSTVKQLTAVFPYKNYRMLESFVLRGRSGQQASTSGSLPASPNTYDFNFRPWVTPEPMPRMIRLDDMRLVVRMHNDGSNANINASIMTGLDVREGQKVVVGKSNVIGTADAIILVVSPKIVE